MKFVIDSKVFKNICERLVTMLNKKHVLSVFRNLKIKCDTESNSVEFVGMDNIFYGKIVTDNVEVIGNGVGYINVEKLKYIYKITGMITIEVKNGEMIIYNSKKRSKIRMETVENYIFYETENRESFFVANKQDVINTFSKLSCCLSDNDNNPVLTGFNIVHDNLNSRIISCDSFKAMRKIVNWNFNLKKNIIIPGEFIKHFTKVSENKIEENVNVFTNGNYIWFMGSDYEFMVRLIYGNYPDVECNFDDNRFEFEFTTNAKGMYDISKEYYDILKQTNIIPMYFHINNNKINTVIIADDFITTDTIDFNSSYGLHNFYWAVRPQYIKKIMREFKNQMVTIYGGAKYFDMWKITDNNGYSAIICPVRVKDEDIKTIEKFLTDI